MGIYPRVDSIIKSLDNTFIQSKNHIYSIEFDIMAHYTSYSNEDYRNFESLEIVKTMQKDE